MNTNKAICITQLKNGYVIYPSDWIILEDIFGPADSCMYAGCVECRNALMYDVPHFIFFCNQKIISDEMEKKIYEACARSYPEFDALFNLQVQIDDTNDAGRLKKWDDAPCFGIFTIEEKDDSIIWNNAPYGAVIIRDNQKFR